MHRDILLGYSYALVGVSPSPGLAAPETCRTRLRRGFSLPSVAGISAHPRGKDQARSDPLASVIDRQQESGTGNQKPAAFQHTALGVFPVHPYDGI